MKINYSVYILLILSLYTRQVEYFLIFFGSIICHEAGHALVMKIFNQKINCIEINFFGGRIDSIIDCSKIKKLFIYLAGITVNFIICLLSGYFGKYGKFTYEYNLIFILFNILPIYPLDGFRIISLFVSNKIKLGISLIFLIALFIFGIINNALIFIIISFYLGYLNYRYFKNYDLNYMMELVKSLS